MFLHTAPNHTATTASRGLSGRRRSPFFPTHVGLGAIIGARDCGVAGHD